MANFASSIHTIIAADRDCFFSDASIVTKFRRYTRGHQENTLSIVQRQMLDGLIMNEFCDNICKKIISEASNRLRLISFRVDNDQVVNFLQDLFVKNLLPKFSGDTHFSTLRDGNFVVTISWDNDRQAVQLNKELWWDGEQGFFIKYNDDKSIAYGVKDWKVSNGTRRIVYFEDHIERYISSGNGWEPYQDFIENLLPVEAWVKSDGSAIGFPFVHFTNGIDDLAPYGVSDLAGGVLGIQDEINDLQRDITTAARMTSYQVGYATGVTLEKDRQGYEVPLKMAPGNFLTSNSKDAKFGVIPAGDLSQLQSAYMVKLQAVSRMTNTPIFLISGGDWPSGAALMQVEQPLISKVMNFADSVGPSWSSVAHKATILANVFGGQALDEEALITTVFGPIEKRDPLTLAQIAKLVQPFVSEQEVLRVLQYNDDDIARIMLERKDENNQTTLLGLGDTIPNVQQ